MKKPGKTTNKNTNAGKMAIDGKHRLSDKTPVTIERGSGQTRIVGANKSKVKSSQKYSMSAKTAKRVSLVLFSGGIDSAHVLADVLRNTDDTVLAHHVHMINQEGRHEAEAGACQAIVAWCRKYFREFTYTESIIDRRKFKSCGADVITVAFEGGIAASNFLLDTGRRVDRYILGINSEEMETISEEPSNTGADGLKRLDHIKAAMAAQCFPNEPPRYHRPELKSKARLIRELGPAMTSLCWTCRRPVKSDKGFKPCGKCKTCKLMADIADKGSG